MRFAPPGLQRSAQPGKKLGVRRSGPGRSDDLEPYQDTLGIRQVSDNLTNRNRQISDQSRDSDDLMVSCECRILYKVNNFYVIRSVGVLVADLLQVRYRRQRFWGLPRNIQSQVDG